MTKSDEQLFDPQRLMAQAREITGVDIRDDVAVEAMTALCHSIVNDGQLNNSGRNRLPHELVRYLCNRSRMQRDYQNHPEIADQKIVSPLFLWGMPRTGSTKLQKVLAASGGFNYLVYWNVYSPSLYDGDRSESTQPRIDDTEDYCRWFANASPDTLKIHPLQTLEPEEESQILMQSLVTPCMMGICSLPSYFEWLSGQSMEYQFTYLRDTLKYLQWQGLADDAKPWVLKSPLYYGMEPQLKEVFPDARTAMTHRHPNKTVPSFCSTLDSYTNAFSDVQMDHPALIQGFSNSINAQIDYRVNHPEMKMLDISYDDIVKSIDGVTRRVYSHCDMEFTAQAQANIDAWERNNPQHKKGKHHYQLSDFDLTEDDVTGAFSRYIGLMDSLFPKTT